MLEWAKWVVVANNNYYRTLRLVVVGGWLGEKGRGRESEEETMGEGRVKGR